MKITIKVLNVKDGDAIIVMLEKGKKNLIMLIDGGKRAYWKKVTSELKALLKYTGKKAPDVVLCTHYDSDHIGGLIPIVKHYGKNIGQVWMFKSLPLANAKAKRIGVHNDPILGSFDDVTMKNDFYKTLSAEKLVYYNTLITSIKQQKELETLVKSLKLKLLEPFEGKCKLSGWPEIKIIAPALSYFKKLFPKGNTEAIISNEIIALEAASSKFHLKKNAKDPFAELDKANKDISSINMASVIMLITLKGRKYLFTGDAGVASFENIRNYKSVLKNIYWLKVPHHASERNINGALIKIMKPKYAAISGKKYISKLVIECLNVEAQNIKSTAASNKTISICHKIG